MTVTYRMHALIKPGIEVEKRRGWTPTITKIYRLFNEAGTTGEIPPEVAAMITFESFCPTCEHQSTCPNHPIPPSFGPLLNAPTELKQLVYLGFEFQMLGWAHEGKITESELAEGIITLVCPHCPKSKESCPSRERWLSKYTN